MSRTVLLRDLGRRPVGLNGQSPTTTLAERIGRVLETLRNGVPAGMDLLSGVELSGGKLALPAYAAASSNSIRILGRELW